MTTMNIDRIGSARAIAALASCVLARLREFYREPEAVFWVYGFPDPDDGRAGHRLPQQAGRAQLRSTCRHGPQAETVDKVLKRHEKFDPDRRCRPRCRTAADAASRPACGRGGDRPVVRRRPPARQRLYQYDLRCPRGPRACWPATRSTTRCSEPPAGRTRCRGRATRSWTSPAAATSTSWCPGLLGMSLMGGGLWGVGFVTVDMRIRKLLKRFLATPMQKSRLPGRRS